MATQFTYETDTNYYVSVSMIDSIERCEMFTGKVRVDVKVNGYSFTTRETVVPDRFVAQGADVESQILLWGLAKTLRKLSGIIPDCADVVILPGPIADQSDRFACALRSGAKVETENWIARDLLCQKAHKILRNAGKRGVKVWVVGSDYKRTICHLPNSIRSEYVAIREAASK